MPPPPPSPSHAAQDMDQATSGTSVGGRSSGSAISSSFTSSAGMTSGSFEDDDDDDDMSTTPSSDFEDASSGGPNEAERRAALAAGVPSGDMKTSDTPDLSGKAAGASTHLGVRYHSYLLLSFVLKGVAFINSCRRYVYLVPGLKYDIIVNDFLLDNYCSSMW